MRRLRFVGRATIGGWTWLVDLSNQAGAVGLVLLALGVSAYSAVALPHWWYGLFILFIFYALLFGEGAYGLWAAEHGDQQQLQARLAEIAASPQPHLRFLHTEVAPAQLLSGASMIGTAESLSASGPATTAPFVAPEPYLFARVQVANDPPEGMSGSRAEGVAGRITFSDQDGNVLLNEMLGRWAETPQRAETGRVGLSLDEAQLDIAPNGVPHPLDVAMKAPDDPDCFAYNFENSNAPYLRLEKHRLRGEEFQVRIVLRPANGAPVSGVFNLRNDARGFILEEAR